MEELIVGDIAIEVIKKDIKNIYLSVLAPNGRVRVSVPKKMKDEAIRRFVLSKLPWIEKHLSKFKNLEEAKKEFVSGESYYFLGERYLLNVIYTDKGKQDVKIRDKTYLDMVVRRGATREQRQKLLLEWYRRKLKALIPPLIEKWEPIIGVKVEDWGVKLMRTRWGTCNINAQRIWINLELAKKNPACLEYIVVHEMVHLLERKHSQRFVGYMDRFLPNWKSLKAQLNGMIVE